VDGMVGRALRQAYRQREIERYQLPYLECRRGFDDSKAEKRALTIIDDSMQFQVALAFLVK